MSWSLIPRRRPTTVQGDIVFELNSMASAVDLFPSERISAMLSEAVETIKACKILLEEKRRIEKDLEGDK